MATIKQEDRLRDELKKLLFEINSINAEDLIQTDRLGSDLDFSNGLPYFERGLGLFRMLDGIDLSRIPHPQLSALKTVAVEIEGAINNIKQFKTTDNNPSSTRDSYIANFQSRYDGWFNQISPVVSFCIRGGTDFDALQKDAREALLQLSAVKAEAEKASTELIAETQSTLDKVRQAAAEVGVAQHATHFQNEATNYKTTSRYWLGALILSAILTCLWGYLGFIVLETPQAEIQNQSIFFIQKFAARITVLMTLVFMLFWCSKNYAAHNHNFIVNRHRQNALSTFETFVKAAGDDLQTKNAVLLQATESIFCAQPSGFISKDVEQSSSGKIIEIVKDLSKLK